jgi:hypothetical protein
VYQNEAECGKPRRGLGVAGPRSRPLGRLLDRKALDSLLAEVENDVKNKQFARWLDRPKMSEVSFFGNPRTRL